MEKAESSGLTDDKMLYTGKTFQILENAPVMIWMADTGKARTYFNRTWLNYRGRTMEQEAGRGWQEGIHPDDVERSLKIYTTAFDKRKEYTKEYRLRRYDGEYRWVLSHGMPLYVKNEFLGYIGSCTDINYRVEHEQQKDEFIAVASHELKTPLTSIKIYTELLHQTLLENDDKASAQLAARVDTQVDRLVSLVKEMLDVSRISGGVLQLNEDYFDMNDLVNEVTEDMQPVTQGHRIVRKLQPVKKVWGDKERIRQVIINLVANAVKYSPGADKVIISTGETDDQVNASIKDFGIGISEKMQHGIFGRFFRATDSENVFPGIGLGLYISAEIVKRHGGKMWFHSDVGKGSEFCFSLPAR